MASTKAMLETLEKRLNFTYLDYQREAIESVFQTKMPWARACLYYKTGAGKTITALTMLRVLGYIRALVIAPPSTHPAWKAQAEQVGMAIETISHAKFRQTNFKLDARTSVIADEMHLFGGHNGKGWTKLRRLGDGLKAPLILASATPNYNDADRVYCIERILDPAGTSGGFLQFLYTHCITKENPFSMTPDVVGFRNFPTAAEYLANLPGVYYLEDDLQYTIIDVPARAQAPVEFNMFGYDRRQHKIMASQMEARHTRNYNSIVSPNGRLQPGVEQALDQLLPPVTTRSSADPRALLFSNSSRIAKEIHRHLSVRDRTLLVHGKMGTREKTEKIEEFRKGNTRFLVGTATLATGTDGLDKVCDRLIIVDDTDDPSLRRQLIGRIMPRGVGGDPSKKQVFRIV